MAAVLNVFRRKAESLAVAISSAGMLLARISERLSCCYNTRNFHFCGLHEEPARCAVIPIVGVVFLMTICAFCATPAFCGNETSKPSINSLFLNIMKSIGTLRAQNHAVAIDVSDRFKPISNYYSLNEFRDYLASKYAVRRVSDWAGTYDGTEIRGQELRLLDGSFGLYDSVRFVFMYDSRKKTIIKLVVQILSEYA